MGNSVTYGIFLLGMVIQGIVGGSNVILFWYTVDIVWWAEYARIILSLYPPFVFAKIFSDIASKSGYHFDPDTAT